MSLHAVGQQAAYRRLGPIEEETNEYDPETQCEECGSQSFSQLRYINCTEYKWVDYRNHRATFSGFEDSEVTETENWTCEDCGQIVTNETLSLELDDM